MENVEMSSLAIIERKDKNEIYLAETKRAIFSTKIILKNAYFQDLNSSPSFIYRQQWMMKHFSVINNNSNDHFHHGAKAQILKVLIFYISNWRNLELRYLSDSLLQKSSGQFQALEICMCHMTSVIWEWKENTKHKQHNFDGERFLRFWGWNVLLHFYLNFTSSITQNVFCFKVHGWFNLESWKSAFSSFTFITAAEFMALGLFTVFLFICRENFRIYS